VRCGAICGTALVPRYPEYVVVRCGGFLWLLGICAPAVSASAKIPIQTKRLLIISQVFNFVNQTPAVR